MINDKRREVEEIDLKIAELKKRRRELVAELGEGRLSWGAIIAGAFGALMIGLGVIALFAANWDAFGREARAAIAVAPVVACGAVAVTAALKDVKTRALWEPLGILWCISVSAATCSTSCPLRAKTRSAWNFSVMRSTVSVRSTS